MSSAMGLFEFMIAALAIILGTSILWLPLLLIAVLVYYAIRHGKGRRLNGEQSQQLYAQWQNLERIEKRIENLESILIEKYRQKE